MSFKLYYREICVGNIFDLKFGSRNVQFDAPGISESIYLLSVEFNFDIYSFAQWKFIDTIVDQKGGFFYTIYFESAYSRITCLCFNPIVIENRLCVFICYEDPIFDIVNIDLEAEKLRLQFEEIKIRKKLGFPDHFNISDMHDVHFHGTMTEASRI
jgi:hypothetical protein